MFKNLNSTNALHLNFGIPIVLLLFFFILNAEFFVIYFIEDFIELIKIYLGTAFLFFIGNYLFLRLKKTNKVTLNLNLYKFVLVFSLVFIFLSSNFIYSEKIFETNIKCTKNYKNDLKAYQIPNQFIRVYKLNPIEYQKYFFSDYVFKVRVSKSIFGYKLISKRTFESLNDKQ